MTGDAAPTLVIGIGNPSRGDDALGPLCMEYLATLALPDVELLCDFQLQVEFALDLVHRQRVIFIDAAARGTAPFAFERVVPDTALTHTSHAQTPAQLLGTCTRVGVALPAQIWLLAIRGDVFELGACPSEAALHNLSAAQDFLAALLRMPEPTISPPVP